METKSFLSIVGIALGGLASCQILTTGEARVNFSPQISSAISQNQDNDVALWENSVHQKINQYRQSLNLSPLKLDSNISQQARIHSENMARGRVPFSHKGFETRAERLKSALSYSRVAENVAYNQGFANPATEAVEGWIDSSGHRHNIEGDFDRTGIGVAINDKGEYYFTQIFLLQR